MRGRARRSSFPPAFSRLGVRQGFQRCLTTKFLPPDTGWKPILNGLEADPAEFPVYDFAIALKTLPAFCWATPVLRGGTQHALQFAKHVVVGGESHQLPDQRRDRQILEVFR